MLEITTILFLAFGLRLYGINWDQGLHLHPDERMLIMVAERLHFFDKLNPEFFNYGSLPIYLLKGIGQFLNLFGLSVANYGGLLYLGRLLSIGVDLLTVYFIWLTTKLIFKDKKIALLSALVYTIAFFPIQNAHFFIVDTFLTFFVTLLVYLGLLYLQNPTQKRVILLGVVLAAAVTTKFTAVIFLPLIGLIILIKNLKTFGNLILQLALFILSLFVFSFLFMPYAYLNWQKFLTDILLQIKLGNDPYVFPYTLQYVRTLPYLYYITNIFYWGLGPLISTLSVLGIFLLFKNRKKYQFAFYSLLAALYYFLLIGYSAAKFMRYMLPIYPFLAIMAGYALVKLIRNNTVRALILIACFIWTALFLNIYTHQHTRIAATNWINQNIPAGATLAVEHWDDVLPLVGGEKYKFVEMTLYDQPDNQQKWQILNQKLDQANYIILSSNRLYVPLQKLADCRQFKLCYPLTAQYYKKLFNGELGFHKVAEFTDYPGLQIGSWKLQIPDDSADESFTVYDHPKVLIFEKNR
jgi:hypothetical protein